MIPVNIEYACIYQITFIYLINWHNIHLSILLNKEGISISLINQKDRQLRYLHRTNVNFKLIRMMQPLQIPYAF